MEPIQIVVIAAVVLGYLYFNNSDTKPKPKPKPDNDDSGFLFDPSVEDEYEVANMLSTIKKWSDLRESAEELGYDEAVVKLDEIFPLLNKRVEEDLY